MDNFSERRKFPRFVCPKDKFCTVTSKSGGGFLGSLKNISREGVALSSTSELEKDGVYDFTINYAGIERHIPAVLRVVWSYPGNVLNTYGAEFSNVRPEDKFDLLESFYEHWKQDIVERKKWDKD